ncbi:MAG: hypothetical protein MN733_03205 [Nitrososphaera sp.]|nr:hypothetical protein [Nitrososphaera sp.]
MTPKEVADRANKLRGNLVNLSRVQIGMSNYKEVMRAYQEILSDLIKLVKRLAELQENALPPTTSSHQES